MRISDWSSDVCSSDLAAGEVRRGGLDRQESRPRLLRLLQRDARPDTIGRATRRPGYITAARIRTSRRRRSRISPSGDRKRVVYGKGVSVLVDLGGGRIIKKKNEI